MHAVCSSLLRHYNTEAPPQTDEHAMRTRLAKANDNGFNLMGWRRLVEAIRRGGCEDGCTTRMVVERVEFPSITDKLNCICGFLATLFRAF